jgi:hypothetical protein
MPTRSVFGRELPRRSSGLFSPAYMYVVLAVFGSST